MKEGDLLKINGESGVWYAELVGIDEEGLLEVFYINRCKDNRWVWKYDDDWNTCHRNCVMEHIPLIKEKALECFRQLGFRPLTENTFLSLNDTVPDEVSLPTGEFDEVPMDQDEEDMSDFIVPDEEGEPFRPASPSIPFVQETHELVNRFNTWEPKNKKEEKLKAYVDNLSHKYKLKDDNIQFAEGRSVDYDHPRLKSVTK